MSKATSAHTVVALVLAGFALTGATAAATAQTVEFRGAATVTATTAACEESGWIIGEKTDANMRFRPPNLGDNGKDTRLAIYYPYYAMSFVLEKGRLTTGFKPVVAGATGSATWVFEAKAEARVTSLAPATITPKTKQLTIKGELRGVDEIADCVLSFSGKLDKH
jgi:hypothetical protein